MLPYWMLFGHAFFYNEMELFYRPFNQLLTIGEFFNLQILQPWELAILGYLLVMFIVSAVHCIAAGFEDKIRTRAYLQFLIDLTIFLFLLIALQPIYCSALLPLLIISNSILIGHFFVLTNSKSSNVFFIISLVGLLDRILTERNNSPLCRLHTALSCICSIHLPPAEWSYP